MLGDMKAAIVLAAVLLSPWAASTVLTAAGVRIQFEKSLLDQALHHTHGNKKQAAEILRLKRTTFTAKLKSLEAVAGC